MPIFRQLKKQVLRNLRSDDFEARLAEMLAMPARRTINPLLGLLYHGEAIVRWRAVTALGAVVSNLADQEIESARVIMRRLMWNLNDESGGMGWGSPEAMGEIMAQHRQLAQEYACILISYVDPMGNFLEHEGLQAGVLWGLGRLARVHPALAAGAGTFLPPLLSSPHATIRGLAIWAAAPLIDEGLRAHITALCKDDALIWLYAQGNLARISIANLAKQALGV